MVWSGHYMLDPVDLQARYSVEDGMAYMNSVFDEPSEEARKRVEEVMGVIHEHLPPREVDFLTLYFLKKKNQTDIAQIFRVSQPTVCYRLKRAALRVLFVMEMPKVDRDQMRADLEELLPDPLDVNIMMMMVDTTCQSEVAHRLNESQGKVRHRFIRSLERMKRDGGYEDYVKLFEYIADNLVILREVQRPSWDVKVTHCVD